MGKFATKEKSTKAPFMLPNLLVLGLLRRPRNAADYLHRAYIIFYWRQCKTLKSRLKIILAFLISPVTIGQDILYWTRKLGKNAAASANKSVVRQIIEQFYLAFFFSIDAQNYYLQEFYQQDGLHRARHFVNKNALKRGVYRLLTLHGRLLQPENAFFSLGDKTQFTRFCTKKGIAVVPILYEFLADGTVIDVYGSKVNDVIEFPEHDVFCKPNVDNEGEGAVAWHWQGDNFFLSAAGIKLTKEQLRTHLHKLASKHKSGSYLVQPLMLPHTQLAPFRKKATPTVRVVTYLDKKMRIKVNSAMLRFSTDPVSVVDNANAGGLVSPVSLITGSLGPAVGFSADNLSLRFDTLPESKEQIKGRIIPYWQETLTLVKQAHSYFPYRLIIGWDILITENGPVILEANSQPGLCYLQKAHLSSLGQMPMAKPLAAHAKSAVKKLYSGNADSARLYGKTGLNRWLNWIMQINKQSVHLLISGKVQGVGYRKWLLKQAQSRRLKGWVRNKKDGSVEAVLSGSSVAVEDVINNCWLGPERAKVKDVIVSSHQKSVDNNFKIKKTN